MKIKMQPTPIYEHNEGSSKRQFIALRTTTAKQNHNKINTKYQ